MTLGQTVSVPDGNPLLLAEVNDISLGGISFRSEGILRTGDRFYAVFPEAGEIKENEAEVVGCDEINISSSFKYQTRAKSINATQKYVEDAIALLKA